MNDPKRIPAIRFPEFTEEWQQRRLGDVTTLFSERNKHLLDGVVYSVTNTRGFVLQTDHFSKVVAAQDLKSYKVVRKGDFAYNPARVNVGSIARFNGELGIISSLYVCFRTTDELDASFLEQYINHERTKFYFNTFGEGGVRIYLWYPLFSLIKITLPSVNEQQKIAGFLRTIDSRISATHQKITLLKKYKEGVVQDIFSGQSRFKDGKGELYPAWEKKQLGKLGHTYTGLTGKNADDFGEGYSYITYKQVFGSPKINTSSFAQVRIRRNEHQNKTEKGDVLFTTSSETPNEVGYSSVLLDDIQDVYLNSFCFGYRISDKDQFQPDFAQFLFRSSPFRKQVVRLAQGSTRYNLSKTELMKIFIYLPVKEEQQKIAALLTSIDDKIRLEEAKLAAAKKFKKALLQKMFV